MRGLTFIYAAVFLLLWWNYQGYFIYLYLNSKKAKYQKPKSNNILFSIIVPVFNEREIIAQKIENLRKLTYKNYEVYFVDASDDDAPQIIDQNISSLPNFKLLISQKRGRSYQINQAFAYIKGDYVLITDCDGLIANNTLDKMLEEFGNDKTGVVGACVIPRTKYKIDILFWDIQNKMRFMESIYGHSPVVVGICYAFRKAILDKLPEDVWADDIYIPFLANLKGYNTIYSQDIIAEELRSPVNLKDLLIHKIRKAEDNIKELLRFLPEVFNMKIQWLVVYLTRFIQILIVPTVIYLFLWLLFFQKPYILILSTGLIIISSLSQLYIFRKVITTKQSLGILQIMLIFLITNFILLAAILKYACFRRKS